MWHEISGEEAWMTIEGEGAAVQPAGSPNNVTAPAPGVPAGAAPTETPSQTAGTKLGDIRSNPTADAHVPAAGESPSSAADLPSDKPKPPPLPDQPKPADPKQEPETAKAWHEDIAEKFGIKDDAVLKKMQRYASLEEYAKGFKELERKYSSGDRGKLPDNPTDDQIKEWREANGIPQDLDGYSSAFELGDGYVVGDDDRTALQERLLKPLLENNAKPEVAKAAVKAFYDYVSDASKRFEERDRQVQQELRDEWGADYDRNKGQIETLLSTHFGDAAEKLRGIMGSDGKGFAIADKGVLNGFLAIAEQLNPKDIVPPANSESAGKSAGRLDELEKIRRSDHNAWLSVKNQRNRAEYMELLSKTGALGK